MPPGGPVNELLRKLPMGDSLRKVKIDRNSTFGHDIEVEETTTVGWEFSGTEDTKLSLLKTGESFLTALLTKRYEKSCTQDYCKSKGFKNWTLLGGGAQHVDFFLLYNKKGSYQLVFTNDSFWNESVLHYKYTLSTTEKQ